MPSVLVRARCAVCTSQKPSLVPATDGGTLIAAIWLLVGSVHVGARPRNAHIPAYLARPSGVMRASAVLMAFIRRFRSRTSSRQTFRHLPLARPSGDILAYARSILALASFRAARTPCHCRSARLCARASGLSRAMTLSIWLCKHRPMHLLNHANGSNPSSDAMPPVLAVGQDNEGPQSLYEKES